MHGTYSSSCLTLLQSLNALQQAAALASATQAVQNNPALLMAGMHPWLNPLTHHLGLVSPAAMAAAMGGTQLVQMPQHHPASSMSPGPGGASAHGQQGSSMIDHAAFAQLQLANGSGEIPSRPLASIQYLNPFLISLSPPALLKAQDMDLELDLVCPSWVL